ncbi:superoxide dismutase [Gaertneriomyces semiglobifer]|nr:superoxide dismutase [Gaertneriomyces semiglobifer]
MHLPIATLFVSLLSLASAKSLHRRTRLHTPTTTCPSIPPNPPAYTVPQSPVNAVAALSPDSTFNGTQVTGLVSLSTKPLSEFDLNSGFETTITVKINGLTPGKHGFHIHNSGIIYPNCTAAGPHYNPFNTTHGAPENSIKDRHVGDLGNVVADENGNVEITLTDTIVNVKDVIGRAIVVHALEDDLGLGGHPTSNSTGNAGARVACGVIGLK